MSTATMNMPRVTLPASDADRIARVREQILNDLRTESAALFDRMQASDSLAAAEGIARGFLARTVGQFDHLGRIERGEA